MVDASDLKSDEASTSCQFKSGSGQIKKPFLKTVFLFVSIFVNRSQTAY